MCDWRRPEVLPVSEWLLRWPTLLGQASGRQHAISTWLASSPTEKYVHHLVDLVQKSLLRDQIKRLHCTDHCTEIKLKDA